MYTKKKGVWVKSDQPGNVGVSQIGYNAHNDYNVDNSDTFFSNVKVIATQNDTFTPPSIRNGYLYFNMISEGYAKVDPNTFSIIEKSGVSSGFNGILTTNNYVIFTNNFNYYVYSLDGTHVQTVSTGNNRTVQAILIADNYVYIGKRYSPYNMKCYNINDGSFVNSFASSNTWYSGLMCYNNSIYAISRGGFYKLDLQLNLLQSYDITAAYGRAIVVLDYVYITADDGYLYKFDLDLNYIHKISVGSNGSRKVSYHNGYLYHCADGYLRQIDLDLNLMNSVYDYNFRSYNVCVSSNYAYVGSNVTGRIYQVSLSNFTINNSIQVSSKYTHPFITIYNSALYCAGYTSHYYYQIT